MRHLFGFRLIFPVTKELLLFVFERIYTNSKIIQSE